jgi:hypothetical protein
MFQQVFCIYICAHHLSNFLLQAVYQCINSQCELSHLGTALHHALAKCYEHLKFNNSSSLPPPLILRNGADANNLHAKRQLAVPVIKPGYNRNNASVPYNRPMRSARGVWSHAPGSRITIPTPMTFSSPNACSSTTVHFAAVMPGVAPRKKVETHGHGMEEGFKDLGTSHDKTPELRDKN